MKELEEEKKKVEEAKKQLEREKEWVAKKLAEQQDDSLKEKLKDLELAEKEVSIRCKTGEIDWLMSTHVYLTGYGKGVRSEEKGTTAGMECGHIV